MCVCVCVCVCLCGSVYVGWRLGLFTLNWGLLLQITCLGNGEWVILCVYPSTPGVPKRFPPGEPNLKRQKQTLNVSSIMKMQMILE